MDGKIEVPKEVTTPKIGRPKVEVEEKVLTNNLYKRQWNWIQKEAKLKSIDAAQYQRMIVQWWIDSVEASRISSIATEQDDQNFERLVNKSKSKKKKSNKRKSNQTI
ncbi:MAG: hypothetical protein ABIO63_02170 [Casimicrobiaceae bacterium]